MDHEEFNEPSVSELPAYIPQANANISRVFGADVNFGLFSIKTDRVNHFWTDDDRYDVDDRPNLEVLRERTERNRARAMREFKVTEWEPDLTF